MGGTYLRFMELPSDEWRGLRDSFYFLCLAESETTQPNTTAAPRTPEPFRGRLVTNRLGS